MKQFNLAEYLRLKEEGKSPKIVTRAGHSVRIVCTDVKDDQYPVLALYLNGGLENNLFTTSLGHYEVSKREHLLDLFFADLEEEPKYRPYKDAEEAYQEAIKHNSWCIDDIGRYRHIDIITDKALDWANFREVLVLGWKWADDGSPCGVKED